MVLKKYLIRTGGNGAGIRIKEIPAGEAAGKGKELSLIHIYRKPYGKLRTLTKAHKLNFILIGLLPFIFGKSPCIDRYIRFKPLYFDMHFNCFIFS